MTRRILHLDSGRDWRGGQRQVYLLAREQRKRGYEPLVVTPPESPLGNRLRQEGVAVCAAPMRAEWDLRAARRIRELVHTWRPEVVHAHDAKSHGLAVAALIGKTTPLVVTRRVQFVPKGRTKYGARVRRFIAISNAVRDALIAGAVDPERIDVVYSGVPSPSISSPRDWRAELSLPPSTVVAGVVGAMSSEKGLHLLEQVAASISADVKARLILVMMGGVARAATDIAGIRTHAAGFIDDIHPAMAGLDMLWHPSTAEGLGTSVIDAMALGVPPVVFRVGGLPELVDEGSGIVVPENDTTAFAHAVERLTADASLRARLASGSRVKAQRFGVDPMVDGTARTYDAVLRVTGAPVASATRPR